METPAAKAEGRVDQVRRPPRVWNERSKTVRMRLEGGSG